MRALLSHPDLLGRVFLPHGVHPILAVYLLEVPCDVLVRGISGDVDVVAFPLRFSRSDEFQRLLAQYVAEMPNAHPTWPERFAAMRLAAEGGLEWPPVPDRLVAIEAKCMYAEETGTLESTKASPSKVARVQTEVGRCFRMEFDGVVLMDIVATQPTDGSFASPWIASLGRAVAARKAARPFDGRRLTSKRDDIDGSLVGCAAHFSIQLGAVDGGPKATRGSMDMRRRRKPRANPLLRTDEKVIAARRVLNERITNALSGLPNPGRFPVVLEWRDGGLRPANLALLRDRQGAARRGHHFEVEPRGEFRPNTMGARNAPPSDFAEVSRRPNPSRQGTAKPTYSNRDTSSRA